MAQFNDFLKAEFLPPSTWTLSRELTFTTTALSAEEIGLLQKVGVDINRAGELKVAGGFHTDLASVPRILWSFLSPWDVARAAVIHDYLYACCRDYYGRIDYKPAVWREVRAISDKIFLLGMNAAAPPLPHWKKKSAYYSVRVFGKKPASKQVNK